VRGRLGLSKQVKFREKVLESIEGLTREPEKLIDLGQKLVDLS
jgi:hypothetical protein